jgi:hypothetical protein
MLEWHRVAERMEQPTFRSHSWMRLLWRSVAVLRRLLDNSRRAGVWPDSVQVIGGKLSMRLPTRSIWVWLTIGLRPADHRDEAWLKKGLPCS